MIQNPFAQKNDTWQISFEVNKSYSLIFIELLEELTDVVSCFEISDNECVINAFFEEKPNLETISNRINILFNSLNIPSPKIFLEKVQDKDWVEEVQKSFKPIDVAKFYIYSNYYQNSNQQHQDKILIEINPGRAFGTGEHETTKLCLESISELNGNFNSILDLGCGSGILAIGASKIFNCPVIASDIDEVAVKIAKENALINQVNDIHFVCSNGFESPLFKDKKFDLIIANILANPLIEMSAKISEHANNNSYIILSGFIDEQALDVIQAYSNLNFKVTKILTQNKWQAITLQYCN